MLTLDGRMVEVEQQLLFHLDQTLDGRVVERNSSLWSFTSFVLWSIRLCGEARNPNRFRLILWRSPRCDKLEWGCQPMAAFTQLH